MRMELWVYAGHFSSVSTRLLIIVVLSIAATSSVAQAQRAPITLQVLSSPQHTPTVPNSISFRGGLERTGVSLRPTSTAKSETNDSCSHLRTWLGVNPTSTDEMKQQYDSLRAYVELCAASDNDFSYRTFSRTDNDVQGYDPTDTTRYDTYRDWLLSVLYLNTTNLSYYCNCVQSMAGTFGYGKYHIPNASLAVLNYLITSAPCHDSSQLTFYNQGVKLRHRLWLLGDTTIPEDTILPPLDSIGLGILLHHSGVSPTGLISEGSLTNAIGNPNPFTKETELNFSLNRMTYVTVEIFDPLGRMVWGDGKGRSLDAGAHTIRIDGSTLPTGTLYARISTGFGEVKTVKLVHQE